LRWRAYKEQQSRDLPLDDLPDDRALHKAIKLLRTIIDGTSKPKA
jgi:hypothetical protein